MTMTNNEMDKAIESVEKLSAETCELCGNPGRIIGDNWYMARCKECEKKT
jgi:hypothetical protein